jgi:hypothetical protein
VAVVEPPPPPPPPPPTWNRPLLIGGIAAAGVGVASVVVSGVFFAQRQSALSTLTGECGANMMHCPSGAQSTFSGGQTDATISTATLVVGLVALAAGGTMIGLARPKPQKPAAGFMVTPGGGVVYGVF